MRLVEAGLVIAVAILGCAGPSTTLVPAAGPALAPASSDGGDTGLRVPTPPQRPTLSVPARQYVALTNAFNRAMASIPEPDRTVEQLTAAYGIQAAVMAEFIEGMQSIEWPALADGHACDLVALARTYEFYDAALSGASSMSVIESLEADRDAATTGWQATIDDLASDLLPPDLQWIAHSVC